MLKLRSYYCFLAFFVVQFQNRLSSYYTGSLWFLQQFQKLFHFFSQSGLCFKVFYLRFKQDKKWYSSTFWNWNFSVEGGSVLVWCWGKRASPPPLRTYQNLKNPWGTSPLPSFLPSTTCLPPNIPLLPLIHLNFHSPRFPRNTYRGEGWNMATLRIVRIWTYLDLVFFLRYIPQGHINQPQGSQSHNFLIKIARRY